VVVIVLGNKVGLKIVDVDVTNISGGIIPTFCQFSSSGGK
jgi:hypothetical protein